MFRQIPRLPVLPVLLVGGAAHFAWEHEQGLHERPHMLCLVCWLNKIAPAPEGSSNSSEDQSPEPPGGQPS
jgi:hypothetical protein